MENSSYVYPTSPIPKEYGFDLWSLTHPNASCKIKCARNFAGWCLIVAVAQLQKCSFAKAVKLVEKSGWRRPRKIGLYSRWPVDRAYMGKHKKLRSTSNVYYNLGLKYFVFEDNFDKIPGGVLLDIVYEDGGGHVVYKNFDGKIVEKPGLSVDNCLIVGYFSKDKMVKSIQHNKSFSSFATRHDCAVKFHYPMDPADNDSFMNLFI